MEDLTVLRSRTKDLTGHKSGRLTVIKFSHYVIKNYGKKEYHSYWHCICECGGEKVAHGKTLLKEEVKSCGCLAFETRQKLGQRITPTSHHKISIIDAVRNSVRAIYVGHAKEIDKEFSISNEEFISLIEANCHYCGCPPCMEKKYSTKFECIKYQHNGVDRKNNEKGYVYGNCLPSCTRCNIQKREMGYEEFLSHVSNIAKNLQLV